ncbi:unnamed protein product [Leptidea sinapis]|uniref:C2H2-type domain-containing protein n=1 Tax=Leptidea sinapis TaxID=189913 RepID=A0A5E4QKD2_9NEOP|nr:unnamed protein product [Leptidea sinapis]
MSVVSKKDANPKEPGGNSEGNEANGDKKYELEKTRKNLREIFSNSNATPIRCKGGIGYACSLCSNQYPEPADLKKHFLKKHDLTSSKNVSADLRCISGKELNKVCVKLDITNLICTRCYVDVDSIEELFDHIESVHNKTLHRNIKQYLVPFKFNTEKLRCCKCPSEFNSFKALLEHMNIHSENFVCNICCGGFINKAKLYIHKQGHNKGEFKCRYCDKVFETTVKKQCHERGAHTFLNALSKCWHCDERFNNHRQKAIHQQEVHGIPMKQQEKKACSICNRVFNNKNALNTHFRRVHLMERTHKCDHCDMTFFGRNALKKHVVKHTGEKNFQCIHCMKAYGRKSTLREHLRIHMGDKRFKCNECGQAFVQKCSWRSHMRSKHGEDIALGNCLFDELGSDGENVPRSTENRRDSMMILTQNRTNLREILRVSNATPLCSRNGIGYKCCLCANVYPNPADLKEHFIKKHDMSKSISSKDINKISGREFRKLSVKLDITNLSCRVCQLEIADLKELLNHLKSTHTNTVTPDVQNHILPFKFYNDVIQCCACAKEFNSFKTILEHMNKHTQNYICSYCSAGYLNKCALELHEGRHKKGEHRCKFCPKIFETLSKRQNHERSYHLCVDRLNKCWHCDERFSSNFRKQMHMLEVHGIQQPAKEKVLCKICNKHYPNKNLYNKHIRRVHLGEKNHKCKFCEKEFFVAKGLNDHLVSHTGEKKFQCYYCMKAFGRKSTLREHIRIHVNDKRFSCADCGQRFTQKCSWRSHMLSKHGERV